MNFDNEITEILVLPMECKLLSVKCPKCMLGGVPERETNCGNQVVEIVGNGGERKYELWQPSCRKWEEKKIVATKLPKSWRGIFFFFFKLWLICGNGTDEIEGKKIVAIDL